MMMWMYSVKTPIIHLPKIYLGTLLLWVFCSMQVRRFEKNVARKSRIFGLEIPKHKKEDVKGLMWAIDVFKSFGFREVPGQTMLAHVQEMTSTFWRAVKKKRK